MEEAVAKGVASITIRGVKASREEDMHIKVQEASEKNAHDQFQRGKGRGSQSCCFNCGLPGHFARDCTRGKNPNAGQSQHQGRVFAVNAKDASKADPLMRGLKVSELPFDLHVHTPHQTVMTRSGCKQVGFKLEGRDFVHDLICLRMVGLEMILGFDWLSKNRVLLDCFEQTIRCMPEGESGAVITVGYYLNSVPVVRDFPEVFPEDIPEFPPQREIEFAIELVPGVRPVSIA
ncbi:uncharacterized protein LOC107616378 [Arachis ipaensis]|uniref:uncharacterized protein LOC107616378 n=1 Tax=Arachis ipaensis TaxID=130454 RepID=UPI0007AF1489|nr:uncharacterized protein LOC107616378 [Arachis ipaensis]XP_025679065.1 uncharacterized protein LOC112779017 [Arachis hypogaea]